MIKKSKNSVEISSGANLKYISTYSRTIDLLGFLRYVREKDATHRSLERKFYFSKRIGNYQIFSGFVKFYKGTDIDEAYEKIDHYVQLALRSKFQDHHLDGIKIILDKESDWNHGLTPVTITVFWRPIFRTEYSIYI